MDPGKAVDILDKGPANWFSWCAVVENGQSQLLADENVKAAMERLLERIASSRDRSLADSASGKPFQKWTGECSDECGPCLAKLEATVAQSGDRKAIEPLVKLGSLEAAGFGSDAIKLAVDRYNGAPYARGEMILLLSHMVEKGAGSASDRQAAKQVVLDATKDKDVVVRMAAVHNLKHLGKSEAEERLKEMSESDDDSYVRKDDGTRVYPVREAARKELEKLEK